jgi:DNA repair protein RecO (recombination protein O)
MKTFKARGIVLREYEAGESDKRLVLLCKEVGRLTAYARGARKPGSKYMAAAQLFAYGDYVIAEGSQWNSVAQAEVIESFYGIRSDYARLCHGHLMLEVCDKAILENTPCDELLLLLLKALSHLSKPSAGGNFLPTEQVCAVFLFRFYLFYGIAPAMDECCVCGAEAELTEDGAYFCDEGYVCKACSPNKKHRLRISQAAWAGLRYILQSGTGEAFRFTARPLVLAELNKAARLCWDSHFEWKLMSGEFV